MFLKCGTRSLDLSSPIVMGILNTTPDSFSDGGSYYDDNQLNLDLVLARAENMVDNGALVLDVGGESTRPGATPVSLAQELDRVVPVVEAISRELDVVVSVDTSSAEVISAAAAAGAGMLNDVRALQRPGALEACAKTNLPVCLMHMQGKPSSMQDEPNYVGVVEEVGEFLLRRASECHEAGIDSGRIILDPGFGFGKTVEHNLELVRHLEAFVATGMPVLAGFSRKSMIGNVLGRDVGNRLAGSLALALMAVQAGARILRVHDVAETVDVLKMHEAVLG